MFSPALIPDRIRSSALSQKCGITLRSATLRAAFRSRGVPRFRKLPTSRGQPATEADRPSSVSAHNHAPKERLIGKLREKTAACEPPEEGSLQNHRRSVKKKTLEFDVTASSLDLARAKVPSARHANSWREIYLCFGKLFINITLYRYLLNGRAFGSYRVFVGVSGTRPIVSGMPVVRELCWQASEIDLKQAGFGYVPSAVAVHLAL